MKVFIKINPKNLKSYYSRLDGNLYFKVPEAESFDVVDGFSYEDLIEGMTHSDIKLIWIQGPCLGTGLKVSY